MKRKVFHVVLGLILIACVICPFVELAIGWNDTILSTGYDTESTLAVVMLLLELVFVLASAIAIFVPDVLAAEPLVVRHRLFTFESGFGILLPDFSPPLSLRI